jgi:flagellar basal-body rod protein FlgB
MTNPADKLYGPIMPGLRQALDLYWKRNEAITSNIANAETPGYRSVDVNFAGELERAFGTASAEVKKTSANHIDLHSESAAHLISDQSGATKSDGNNVDLDIQMGRLALNSGRYETAANMVRKKISILRTAIQQSMR